MIGPDLTAAAPSSHLRADVAQVDAATLVARWHARLVGDGAPAVARSGTRC